MLQCSSSTHYPLLPKLRQKHYSRRVLSRAAPSLLSDRTSMAEYWVEIQIPQQKLYNGIQFPSVLSPSSTVAPSPSSLSVFTKTIQAQRPFLQSLLHKSGAVLFRGFPLNTASDFNDVVEAFGFEEFPYVGGAAPRTNVVGRVFTANESPPDQKIPFHHEMAQVYILYYIVI